MYKFLEVTCLVCNFSEVHPPFYSVLTSCISVTRAYIDAVVAGVMVLDDGVVCVPVSLCQKPS